MIRLAREEDLDGLFGIFDKARVYMRQQGNHDQWPSTYPSLELLKQDMKAGGLHVWEEAGEIHGVFALLAGPDPTYHVIEGGWLNDQDHAAIHRIASDGQVKDLLGKVLDYAWQTYDNIRIDTHEKNTAMKAALAKHGFSYCGIIYLANGDSRLAYHLVKE